MLNSAAHTVEGANTSDTSAYIRKVLDLLFEPGDVVELRSLHTLKGTISGYFNDFGKLADEAARLSGNVPAVYVTANPVDPALLSRAVNRLEGYARETTNDKQIVKRRWFLLDFDPKRHTGISSTDVEHDSAIKRAAATKQWLETDLGFPGLVIADSGNGGHLLGRVDLDNTREITALLEKCIKAVAFRFSDEKVDVDLTVFNPARIWKLYGTLAGKGDNTAERPHRLAKIIKAPRPVEIIPLEKLQQLAATLPEHPRSSSAKPGHSSSGQFNLEQLIVNSGLDVIGPSPWNSGRKWIFQTCPWNPDHTNRSAWVIEFQTGAIDAGCRHNGCANKSWHDLRDVVEPGWREKRGGGDIQSQARRDQPEDVGSSSLQPKQSSPKLELEALHGLAGEIVKAIGPHTEAHDVALLLNSLAAFGNVIGCSAHATVQTTEHPGRLFVVQVGPTSKGRKDTGWSPIKHLFSLVDPEWKTGRIKSGLSSGEGLVFNVRDPIYKQEPVKEKGRVVDYQEVMVDPGESDKRLLVVEPELASTLTVMGREGNTLSAMIRQAWDDGDLSPLTRNNPIKSTGAHITLITFITQQELLSRLDETHKANGFANRFLWALVERSKELPEGAQVPQEIVLSLADKLSEAVSSARKGGIIKRDSETREAWAQVYGPLSAGRPGLTGAILSRAEAQVLRLSVLYALLDVSLIIRIEHLKAALAVWDYCESSTKLIFGNRLGDPTADRILDTLRSAGAEGLTDNDIYELFGRHRSTEERDRALNLLKDLKLIRSQIEKTAGRSRTQWLIV